MHPEAARDLLQQGWQALQAGDAAGAVHALEQALSLDPGLAASWYPLGLAYRALGQPWRAWDAFAGHSRAFPADARGWLQLAEVYQELQLSFHVSLCYERALAAQPDSVQIYEQLARAWERIGRRDGVAQYFERMLQLSPAGRAWYAARPDSVRAAIAARRRLIQFGWLQYRFGDPDCSDSELFDLVASLLPPAGEPLPETGPALAGSPLAPPGPDWRPLRLGYLSRELGEYSSAAALWPLLRHRGPGSELYAYNDTPASAWSAGTEAFKPHFAQWRDVAGLSNRELAERIRADGIDVLVDMAGLTDPARHGVYAHRPAPVQLGGLGFGFSACHGALDYALGDACRTPPEIAARYPEQVVNLQVSFHWQPPDDGAPPGEPPSLHKGYITFGSSNTLNKLNPRVLRLWGRLLQALPTARLYLKTPALYESLSQDYLRALCEAHGIDPARLRLQGHDNRPHARHYYPEIDIALDPFPYQGGVTTSEALWMGVPVVSLMHPDWRARVVSANILTAMGLSDWLADSEAAYLERALSWAGDPGFLRRMRRELRPRLLASPVCDGPAAAAEFEALCLELWRQHQQAPG